MHICMSASASHARTYARTHMRKGVTSLARAHLLTDYALCTHRYVPLRRNRHVVIALAITAVCFLLPQSIQF